MKMRSRLLGIVALAAVSLAAMSLAVTQCRRGRQAPAATAPENPPAAETQQTPVPEQPPATGTPQAAALPGFALIPAGEFTMGDSLDGDEHAPPRQVNVSAFYMGQKEVTKAEWDNVRTWAISHGYPDLGKGKGKAADHPVAEVSWFDVIKWCNARSEQDGLTPCYTVGGAVMRSGTTEPTVNWATTGYRLPTEAEWEKAARGGLSGKRFPWGDTISHSQANFRNNCGEPYQTGTTGWHPTYGNGTAPVGSFAANGYDLHDMAGNVGEWCWDWNGTFASGVRRVVRGGNWYDNASWCRIAIHAGDYPAPGRSGTGFRTARSSVPK